MTDKEVLKAFHEANEKLDEINIRSPNLDTMSKVRLWADLHEALCYDVITKEDKSDIEKIIVRAVERGNKEPEEEQ